MNGRCSQCGSACALGFRAFNASIDNNNVAVKNQYKVSNLNLCGPTISTSQACALVFWIGFIFTKGLRQALTLANPVYDPIDYGIDQMKMGCVPCDCGTYNSPNQVVFILPGKTT